MAHGSSSICERSISQCIGFRLCCGTSFSLATAGISTPNAMKFDGLTFLGLSLSVSLGWALIVPQHHCENYFTYMKQPSGQYFGLFTAPRGGINSVKWVAVFNADKTQQVRSDKIISLKLP